MFFLDLFRREKRSKQVEFDDGLLVAILGGKNSVTKAEALEIPSVQSCVNIIANCVSTLPIKLYEEINGEVKEITDDNRLRLLNKDTGDTVNGTQLKRLWVADYLLGKGAYTYISRDGAGNINGLYYVDEAAVSVISSPEPIFKTYTINVNGKIYYPHEFIKICRKADGKGKGKSVIEENGMIMAVAYNLMKLENGLVKKGGNKKGYLESETQLSKDEIERLKSGLSQLYSNSADVSDNVVVLNKGVKFHESSATSVEMQLNESKINNSSEICKLFGVPEQVMLGNDSNSEKLFLKNCITPMLNIIEAALDSDLLLESEKATKYFAFDDKELTRGSIQERYNAYAVALQNNFMQIDEIREREDLKPLGFNFIKLGLNDVMLDPKTKVMYTPNTNAFANLGNGAFDSLGDFGEEGAADRAAEVRFNSCHDPKSGEFARKEKQGLTSSGKSVRMSKKEKALVTSQINTYYYNRYSGITKGTYYSGKYGKKYTFSINGYDDYVITEIEKIKE
ncbi:MAG: phage portal protein [Oscillospiraceae bacterium]|nr:phage portal protein [Oscillospiraceae bacterium]